MLYNILVFITLLFNSYLLLDLFVYLFKLIWVGCFSYMMVWLTQLI